MGRRKPPPVHIISEDDAAVWRKERGIPEPSNDYAVNVFFLNLAKRTGDWSHLTSFLRRELAVGTPIEMIVSREILEYLINIADDTESRTGGNIKVSTWNKQIEAAAFKLWREEQDDPAPVKTTSAALSVNSKYIERACDKWSNKEHLRMIIQVRKKDWDRLLG